MRFPLSNECSSRDDQDSAGSMTSSDCSLASSMVRRGPGWNFHTIIDFPRAVASSWRLTRTPSPLESRNDTWDMSKRSDATSSCASPDRGGRHEGRGYCHVDLSRNDDDQHVVVPVRVEQKRSHRPYAHFPNVEALLTRVPRDHRSRSCSAEYPSGS